MLTRITSDCKPWKTGGKIALCPNCDCAQSLVNEEWQSDADTIYANYEVYHQAEGAEQLVFNPSTGQSENRSDILVKELSKFITTKNNSWLDIGCGNGALLKAINKQFQHFQLYGSEFSVQHKEKVLSIPNVKAFYTEHIRDISNVFDVVSMVHVLEHIPYPIRFLISLKARLNQNAIVFIQVPDCELNPYMLTVADHCTHFTKNTLSYVANFAGYRIAFIGTWINKEISCVLSTKTEPDVIENVQYLIDRKQAIARLEAKQFAVFGTSIGAAWIYAEFKERIKCFIDEDKNRIGKKLFGLPIVSVKDPIDVPIVSSLTDYVTMAISQRLNLKML